MDRIKKLINERLPVGSFARNVVTLMTGTTFAQALLILVAPILTRLYSPEDYGVYALFTSILAILTVVSCGRYELAIVLPEEDEDAANLLVLSIVICLIMATLILFLVGAYRIQLATLLDAPELTIWLWLMPLSVITAGLFYAFNYWSTRRKHFRRLASRQITQSTVTAATQIGGGMVVHSGPGGLIGGLIVGQLAATGRLAWQIWRDEGKQLLLYVKGKGLRKVLVRYKGFPIYSTWLSLFNTASAMLPALVLGYFFTPAVVGYYALGHRVLSLPMGVIGNSIAQAFFPRATEAKQNGNLDKITYEMFQQLLTIGLVPILLVAIVAPELFSLVFGYRWFEAGVYVQWLCVWIILQFISSPISTIIYVLEKQQLGLIYNISLFTANLVALCIGGIFQNPLLAIKLLGLVGAVMYFIYTALLFKLAQVRFTKILLVMFKIILNCLPFILIPVIGVYMAFPSFVNIVVSVMCGFVFIFWYIKRSKEFIKQE